MTRHYCAPLPDSLDAFCSFLEQSGCLPKDYGQSDYLGPLAHVLQHMKGIGVRSLLLQDRVRDPDFFAEHQAYYLGQHRHISPLCARVHGFRNELPAGVANPDPVVDLIDRAAPQDYAGFTTIRPLRPAPVGATILGCETSYILPCVDSFPVHIAGVRFEVIGTPFLQQDNSVGACAQASMWMALRTQRKRAGNAAFNTAELTLAATRYLMEDRVFPGRRGLTIGQMLQAIRFAGHEPCVIPIERRKSTEWPAHPNYEPADLERAKVAIEPYVESGLPAILCMARPTGEGHAVIAIGKTVDGPPKTVGPNVLVPSSLGGHKFIIHNDSTGPYLQLETRAAADVDGWTLDDVISIIVPMPDGVTVTAAEVAAAGKASLDRLVPALAAGLKVTPSLQDGAVVRHFLMQRHAFRAHMHRVDEGAPGLKNAGRSMDLPPWLWVYEVHLQDEYSSRAASRVCLLAFDATSDIEPWDMPLLAHLNGALVDAKSANVSMTILSKTVVEPPTSKFIRSLDDRLAMPIPPQSHIDNP
jgi:hypothetical protein